MEEEELVVVVFVVVVLEVEEVAVALLLLPVLLQLRLPDLSNGPADLHVVEDERVKLAGLGQALVVVGVLEDVEMTVGLLVVQGSFVPPGPLLPLATGEAGCSVSRCGWCMGFCCCLSARTSCLILVRVTAASSRAQETEEVNLRNTSGSIIELSRPASFNNFSRRARDSGLTS